MASSGTFTWAPTVAELIDESAERARIDPGTLTAAQQFSARRSLNTVLQRWSTERPKLRFIENLTLDLVAGTRNYNLPAKVLDVLYAVHVRAGTNIPMAPMDREDYLAIPDRAMQGRSDRYWVERKSPCVLWLWQVPENSTDDIYYSALRRAEDIKADMTQTPDLAYLWHEALMDEMAARLYAKWGSSDVRDREGKPYKAFDLNWLKELKNTAALSYRAAMQEDRERVDTHFSVHYGRR